MRIKKHAIRITVIVASISLFVALITFFIDTNENFRFISNAFLGVFASSLSTLFVFIYEYRAEREHAIINFYKVIYDIKSTLDKIPHLFLLEDNLSSEYYECGRLDYILKDICQNYVSIINYQDALKEAFEKIDFFLDFTLKAFIKSHCIKLYHNNLHLSRKEKKISKEEAKPLFRREHYLGKRKDLINVKIVMPINELMKKIGNYPRNDFYYYLTGDKTLKQNAIIREIIELEKIIHPRDETGSSHNIPMPWYWNAVDLRSVLVGSRVFWVTKERNEKGKEGRII